MAGEWGSTTLRGFTVLITKGTTPTTLGYPFAEYGINFIKSEAITDDGTIDDSTFAHIDEDTHKALARSILSEGDILFSMAGVYLGKTAVVTKSVLPANTNQAVGIIRVDSSKALPRFIHYALSSPVLRSYVRSSCAQSAQPNYNLRDIGNLPIPDIPLPEQKAIAHILGSLDDKIELNRKMNETLEAMARAIFKSWFVDFDPVKAKAEGRKPAGMDAETAKLFPDSFEDSELGKIPKGWRVGKLGDVSICLKNVADLHKPAARSPYIGLEHMPRRNIALADWGNTSEIKSQKYMFKRGNILFGKLRPYFHKVGVAPLDGVCSTDILVIEPIGADWHGFVLGHVSSDEFIAYTDRGSKGTRMPRTCWGDMAKYPVCLPCDALAQSFTAIEQTFLDRVALNTEGTHLASTRDTLLPKLLSGELRIKDAERFSEAVA